MNLRLQTAYWNDQSAREAFKRFILEIHGLDFSAWEAAGYWDESYRPFSLFEGESVVANVCLYLLDAIVHGSPTQLLQISGVGTRPEFRRQGLNRRLTQIGLDWARGRYTGLFLFANDEAVPFYERCGFEPLTEFIQTMDVEPVAKRPGIVPRDCARKEDRDRVFEFAQRRAPISNVLAIMNPKLFMFHALYGLRGHLYEIPEIGVLIAYRRTSRGLQILDLLGECIPRWEDLYPYLVQEDDRTVEFHFSPDRLGLTGTQSVPLEGNNCFVQGAFPVPCPVFPYTSRA
jgi:GNAT superfamily N-acetyltransferase